MSKNPRIVFSDVDDTLIRAKSLVGFTRHLIELESAQRVDELRSTVRELTEALKSGTVPRDELNRAFYRRVLGGRTVALVAEASHDWYRVASERTDFYRPSVVKLLREARRSGAEVALVSGSFETLLAPVARHVDASALLVAALGVHDGKYSGETSEPTMIGPGKAQAVKAHAEGRGVSLSECAGVGDDRTDIPFLELVGTPYVVEDSDEDLLGQAKRRGWRVLREGESLHTALPA